MALAGAPNDLDAYPCEAEARVRFELTADDAWYRSKDTRLERPFYDHHHPENERAFVRSLIGKYRIGRGARLIDLDCGNGFYADAFAREGLRVTGADLSDVAIAYARRKHGDHVDWIAADALTLPFENQFDYGFCHYFTLFNAAEVPSEGVEYGRALMRYLRPGGTLFFVWHSDLTAIRLPGGSRFGIMNYTIKQIEAMFPDFRSTSYAVDGMARMAVYLGPHAYNKYFTRLCCAGVYFAASNWHRARIVVAIHK
jgi:SAM-dependent methyltransferase